LKLVYDRRGDIVDLVPLEHWSEDLFQRIRHEVDREVEGGATRVRRMWAFASRRTAGTWRYRGVFQICEPPAGAPTAGQLVADHPLVLEVAFVSSTAPMPLGLDRSVTATRRVELLLSVLLDCRFHQLPFYNEKCWVLVEKQRDPLVFGTELRQVGFTADGFVAELDDFSVAGESMPEVDVAEYWGIRGRDMSEPLSIPNTLADSLDLFFLLPPQDQNQFLRACYWFQQGDDVWRSSMSSAFTSYIQAIETLQPPPRIEDHCKRCNRPIGPDPTAQFVDFVERHAPGLPEKDRRRLYAVRSNVSHGNELFIHDEYRGFGGHFTPFESEQRHDTDTARLVARVCLMGWLVERGLAVARATQEPT